MAMKNSGKKMFDCSAKCRRISLEQLKNSYSVPLSPAPYHLAKAPQIATKLREELKEMNYIPGSETELRDIQDAKYLNGIINEALRLHPAVPSGLLRVTPPEGIHIDGNFIPGGVTVSSPLYSMGRCKFFAAYEFVHLKKFINYTCSGIMLSTRRGFHTRALE